jgi:cell division protein FtsI/penicillin-binding protein 2
MNSLKKHQEKGAVLLVSMIMLLVLTLLVVFAIRSGNTNLRIAGNMQSQAEASAAAQQVIEQVIEQIKVTDNIGSILAQTVPVSIAGATYNVMTTPMNKCLMEVPILNADLNPSVAEDVSCFENPDTDQAIKADGTMTTKPSACKNQLWEIQADVTDGTSGAKVTQVQGLAVRAPATMTCLSP